MDEKKDEIKQEADVNTETAPPAAACEPEVKKEPTPEEILQEKDAKIAELNDKYLRALAEQDNFRKRMQKDKEDFVKYSRSEAASLFLPVLDNFDRAVSSADKNKDFKKLKDGIDMVIKQFEGVLKELGMKEIPTQGIFDPNLHHVVHKEHAAGKKDGEIIEVYQKGFMMDDKVVRPASVKVAHNEPHKKEEHKNHDHKENGHNHNQNHENKK